MNELIVRHFTEKDINLITDSWGTSYHAGSKAHHYLSPESFHSFHRPIRERFLKKENATILLASWNNDPDLILGWLAYESMPEATILHYIYIKSAFKKEGVARYLMDMAFNRITRVAPVIYTHLTEKALRIMKQKKQTFRDFVYIPNLV